MALPSSIVRGPRLATRLAHAAVAEHHLIADRRGWWHNLVSWLGVDEWQSWLEREDSNLRWPG